MKIIIEGPDGAGKTTFASRLKRTNLDYRHLSDRDPRTLSFYRSTMAYEDIIWDRHFISEYVYSKVLGRDTEITDRILDQLIEEAKDQDIWIVICLADQYYIEDEADDIKANHNKIENEYKRIAEKYKLPILWRQ